MARRNPPELAAPIPQQGPEPLQQLESEADFSSAADTAEHLDAAFAAASGTPGAETGADSAAQGPVFMPRDEWCKVWLAAHGIAGFILNSAALQRVTPELRGAMDAAGAIYDTAAEVSWLHWLLDPHSKWFQRAIVVAGFYGPLFREVQGEIRARRAKPSGSGKTEGAARQERPSGYQEPIDG
jgi:hypothetical protein